MPGTQKDRLLVIGLECGEPSLVFDAWRDDLPQLRRLMEDGLWGRMESCHPPLAVPAWSCLMTGRDPGELGIYGPRNRADRGYGGPVAAEGQLRSEQLWQTLAGEGRRCAVVGASGASPPSPPAAPSPPDGLDRLLGDLRARTAQRFEAARRLLESERWDLFILLEAETAQVQSRFWRFFDREHSLYRPGNRFQSAVHDHYVALDAEIGRTMEAAGEASVLVVSDRGARRLQGGVRINEWLLAEGYLRLLPPGPASTELRPEDVDWQATRAWGDGEECGRIFFNLEGREPRGCVAPGHYEALRDEIAAKLEAMEDPFGGPLGTRVLRPDRIYRALQGVAPDLLVYFGDLAWRCRETLGGGELLALPEEAGLDDSNGALHGIFIYLGPEVPLASRGREVKGIAIYDVAPTLYTKFHLPAPADLRGRVLF
jgi:predicted AlkP superfamily phosphohydrolase/phosphomutase